MAEPIRKLQHLWSEPNFGLFDLHILFVTVELRIAPILSSALRETGKNPSSISTTSHLVHELGRVAVTRKCSTQSNNNKFIKKRELFWEIQTFLRQEYNLIQYIPRNEDTDPILCRSICGFGGSPFRNSNDYATILGGPSINLPSQFLHATLDPEFEF